MQPHHSSRRNFLCTVGVSAVGSAALGPSLSAADSAPARVVSGRAGAPLIGLQIAPFNLLDEGIERCLDLVRETAAVNAIFCYSHTYYGIPYKPLGRPVEVLAPDHGIVPRAEGQRRLWPVWVRHDRANFRDTSLWFADRDAQAEFSDRDILREVREPARQRGIQLYARILEPGLGEVDGKILNWDRIRAIDLDGRKSTQPCRNQPDYRAWWAAMVTDLFRNYDLDGYQWGAERSGPLASLFASGTKPACFCPHCVERARREGVDAERAKAGFRALIMELADVTAPESAPERILRCLLRFPEVLAWERLWRDALEDLARLIHDRIKAVRPEARVGRHLDSSNTTLNPFSRAGTDYAALAGYTDFIKPILYHDVMGSRLSAAAGEWSRRVLPPLAAPEVLELFAAFNGWQGAARPDRAQLATEGLPPAYVGHETQRIVARVGRRADVIPGIGFDVPTRTAGKMGVLPSDPAKIEAAIDAAREAGAAGVLLSREYDEMRLPSLRAAGRAVRRWRS